MRVQIYAPFQWIIWKSNQFNATQAKKPCYEEQGFLFKQTNFVFNPIIKYLYDRFYYSKKESPISAQLNKAVF